jgi:hypothetical protein
VSAQLASSYSFSLLGTFPGSFFLLVSGSASTLAPPLARTFSSAPPSLALGAPAVSPPSTFYMPPPNNPNSGVAAPAGDNPLLYHTTRPAPMLYHQDSPPLPPSTFAFGQPPQNLNPVMNPSSQFSTCSPSHSTGCHQHFLNFIGL